MFYIFIFFPLSNDIKTSATAGVTHLMGVPPWKICSWWTSDDD